MWVLIKYILLLLMYNFTTSTTDVEQIKTLNEHNIMHDDNQTHTQLWYITQRTHTCSSTTIKILCYCKFKFKLRPSWDWFNSLELPGRTEDEVLLLFVTSMAKSAKYNERSVLCVYACNVALELTAKEIE